MVLGLNISFSNFSCLVTFRSNGDGQCGQPTTSVKVVPRLSSPVLLKSTPVRVAATKFSSFCTTVDGQLFGWGCAANGSLGQGREFNESAKPLPIRFPQARTSTCSTIFGGASSTSCFAQTSDGELYSWGNNTKLQT